MLWHERMPVGAVSEKDALVEGVKRREGEGLRRAVFAVMVCVLGVAGEMLGGGSKAVGGCGCGGGSAVGHGGVDE